MIEVIEERARRRISCSECNSRLEFGQEDIKDTFSGKGSFVTGYITCPVCGAILYVTKKPFSASIFGDEYRTNKDLKEFFK